MHFVAYVEACREKKNVPFGPEFLDIFYPSEVCKENVYLHNRSSFSCKLADEPFKSFIAPALT